LTDCFQTLASLIRINSVNSFYADGPGEAEIANFVESFFHERGIETWTQSVFPGRHNVIARLPGRSSNRRLILEAHMDTVSVAGMAIDPFEPRIENGRMYGRGSCDTKAGLATMMHAVADLHANRIVPPCEVWLCAVVDEEYSFRGVVKLCEGLAASGAIVAEPTELRTVIASKGVLRWRIHSHGVAAHSSKVQLGNNAIHHMARLVLALEEYHKSLSANSDPLLGPSTGNVGIIQGGTQVNFVPDRCVIEIDRRLLPGETTGGVMREYQNILNQLHGQFANCRLEQEYPMLVDIGLATPREAKVAQCSKSVLESLKLDGEFYGVPFGSDASKLSAQGIPSIIFGPGSIDRAHAAIEYVELDQVEKAHEYYRRFMTEFEG
jgi:acetylornithine deacetylase/succinyl-diaminopimelate desuccinylase family protein